MKNKIKEALKTEYVNLGLGEKAFDGVAILLAKTTTDENDIATVIKGAEVKGLLTAIQGEGDKSRQEKSDLQKKLDTYMTAHPEAPPEPIIKPVPPVEGTPLTAEMIKKIFDQSALDMITPIHEKFAAFEQEKAKGNLLQQAVSMKEALKLKPEWKKQAEDAWAYATTTVAPTDTPEAIVDRFKGRYDQYMSWQGVNGYVPADGSGGTEKSSTAKIVDAIIKKDAEKTVSAQTVAERFKVDKPSI